MEIQYKPPHDGDRLQHEHWPENEVVSAVLRVKMDLDPALDAPFGVDVLNDAGDRLTIAFDDQEGFMMFDPAEEKAGIKYTLGDLTRTDNKVVLCSQWTKMAGKYPIPTKSLLSEFDECRKVGKTLSSS